MKKLVKVLDDIKRRKAEKKIREESNNPINKTDNQQLVDQEDGELSNEDMINVVDHSDFDDSPRASGDGMRPIAQSSPRYPNHKNLVMPSPYRILTNNPATEPVTPPRQTKPVTETPKKRSSLIRFPAMEEAQRNHVQAKIDLYVQERETQDKMRTANPVPNSPPANRQENAPSRDWYQSPGGGWYNDAVCLDNDNAELGSAEPSEGEEAKETKDSKE